MLRAVLIAALLCASEAAFSQELTAEQRSACKGDYQKILQRHDAGRRQDYRLPVQIERQAHGWMPKSPDRSREKVSFRGWT
jgi:hypothetical protein